MTANETATHVLDTYAAGGETEGGWLYAKALQQARLDYSPESLGRLDQLLGQLRDRAPPTQAQLKSLPGRNFQALVAYYLIELARRRTGAELVWHDRDSALRVLPPGTQLPVADFARLLVIAEDQGAVFMPLAWLAQQFTPSNKVGPSAGFLGGLVEQIERNGPAVWWRAAHAMGRIASWQMMMAADGGAVLPTMLRERLPTTWVMLAPDAGANLDEALDRGARAIDTNPEGHAWQVLSYDGWVPDGDDRLDAVIVVAATYGERPLRMKVAFPYRPKRAGGRFAILQPMLREANVPDEVIGQLNGALERGIQSIKWAFGVTWNELREAG